MKVPGSAHEKEDDYNGMPLIRELHGMWLGYFFAMTLCACDSVRTQASLSTYVAAR